MIGESSQQLTWHLEGDVQGRDRSRLEISLAMGMGEVRQATLIQDGLKTFMLRDGELEEVSNPFSLGTPTSNYLDYLDAAGSVRVLEPVTTGGETFTRYGFDIDGPQMALNTMREFERQMRGQMPAGVQLQPPANLQRMTGSGEIWVDSQGLPRRQIMTVVMPEVDARYNAETHLIIDFYNYGAVDLVPAVAPGPEGGWQLQAVTEGGEQAVGSMVRTAGNSGILGSVSEGLGNLAGRVVSPTWLSVLLVLLLVLGFVRFYRRNPRRAYTLVAVTLTVVLTSGARRTVIS